MPNKISNRLADRSLVDSNSESDNTPPNSKIKLELTLVWSEEAWSDRTFLLIC